MRRPVAVVTLTMLLPQAYKLIIKDKLVRTGSWNERTNHMGIGLVNKIRIIGAGRIGSETIKLAKPFFKIF